MVRLSVPGSRRAMPGIVLGDEDVDNAGPFSIVA
jgi:hypothetical protein